jgi:probable rRNA maturation factor
VSTPSLTTEITNTTKGKLPRLPFDELKNEILGKNYELSISFVTASQSRTINRTYRQKDYATNILSFELTKTSGELIIEPKCVARDAVNFDMDYPNFLTYLLIHGMLHLKGMDHSSTMDRYETRYKKKFGVHELTHTKKRAVSKSS